MKSRAELLKGIRGPGGKADFEATRHASFALLRPLSERAISWLIDHVSPDASWEGDSLIVEMRYFPAIADGIIEAGLTFERETWPQ